MTATDKDALIAKLVRERNELQSAAKHISAKLDEWHTALLYAQNAIDNVMAKAVVAGVIHEMGMIDTKAAP